METDILSKRTIPKLPEKLSVGYASWNECDEKIYESVINGVNVLMWFSIDLGHNDETGRPEIKRGPDFSKVSKMIKRFKDNKLEVINIISIGGWNSPHPDVRHTGKEYYETFKELNRKISKKEDEFYGFDGIDWDIEGHDDFKSPINKFSIEELNIMVEFSLLCKQNNYIVSMAPSESYLDFNYNFFSLSLLYNHKEWEETVPNFNYHGRNCYAYLIKNIGLDNIDFISIQLYEGYTHTLYKYKKENMKFSDILLDFVKKIYEGYEVDFEAEVKCEETKKLGKQIIKLNNDKLVIGLANAWACDRFLFVSEKEINEAYQKLLINNFDVKGFMFWDIADEGKINKDDKEHKEFYMAKIINKLFNIRK